MASNQSVLALRDVVRELLFGLLVSLRFLLVVALLIAVSFSISYMLCIVTVRVPEITYIVGPYRLLVDDSTTNSAAIIPI